MAKNDRFLRACHRLPVDRTPVWYMRQAGRYQPEYRAIRQRYSLLDICREPEVCTQVSLLPVQQLGVDAAILFSDIMVPMGPIGIDFDIKENVGPVIANPIRSTADVAALRPLEPEASLPHVLTTIGMLARELTVPLIGFAGAPFTLASYLIEGGPSRHYSRTKAMMFGQPDLWFALMGKLEQVIIVYLRAQVQAGADAVQIFDSWVGALAPADYATYVLPSMQRIFAALADLPAPRIYFGVETGELLGLMAQAGADVVGTDWRVPLDAAWQRIGPELGIQGNLDPAVLGAPWEAIWTRAADVLQRAGRRPGHIFNLGHGVLPDTPVAALQRLTEYVHAYAGGEATHG